MADKPRILTNGKDMVWTLIPLLAVCAFVAIASGNCSVGLSGQAAEDRRPAFELTPALRADVASMPFPIRIPPTPSGWKPNSGSRDGVGAGLASMVGWVTASGAYLQLTQTNATEEELVAHLGGDDLASGSGTRAIDGRTWVTYHTYRDQKFWITDFGDARVAVLSIGPDEDLATMATLVQRAPAQ
ncbi:MAG: DUF4245 domain-containing protein [Gordonia sp. (in: high G+C Gram-positive bacteria)]